MQLKLKRNLPITLSGLYSCINVLNLVILRTDSTRQYQRVPEYTSIGKGPQRKLVIQIAKQNVLSVLKNNGALERGLHKICKKC